MKEVYVVKRNIKVFMSVVLLTSAASTVVASQQEARATVDQAPKGYSPVATSYAIALLSNDDYQQVITGIEENQGEYEWPRMDNRIAQGWSPQGVHFVICSRGYGSHVSVYYAHTAKHLFDLFPQKSQQAFFENTPLAIAGKARQVQVPLSDEGASALANIPEPAQTNLKNRVNFKLPRTFVSWMRSHKWLVGGAFVFVIGGLFAYKWNQAKRLLVMR